MPSHTLASAQPSVDFRQKLRIRRLLLSVAVYVPCALMLVMVSWLGFLPAWFAPVWVGIFTATNAFFLVLIKTQVNLRFKDPSMTMAQMAVAIAAVALILYHAGAIRGGLLMLLLVILMFGVLRLSTAEVLVMGVLSSAAYAAVIMLLSVNRPDQIDLRVEWVQWATLTFTLAVVCPVVGYMGTVRRRLSESLRTIKEMAQRDALTGVFNRHHMSEALDREISRSERGAPAFLALIADIDHFKHINDTYGHLVGDEVLKTVANSTRQILRKADYLCRYGGEEFVMILAADDAAQASAACERIRENVAQLRIPELQQHGVTISIGGSFYRQGDTQATLLGRADAALYRAKNGGRDRVEIDIVTVPMKPR